MSAITDKDQNAPSLTESPTVAMTESEDTRSRKSHSSRRRTSLQSRSRASDDSDPYEALERALTPDLETEAEHAAREPISHTRTGTSIGSTASRPPDFEVVFEEDDSE